MTRQPSPAELDALAAWWLSKRHIGKAASMLGRKRQTIANALNTMRRMDGATDNVELALKYMDEIQSRRVEVMERSESFAEVRQYPPSTIERTVTAIPSVDEISQNIQSEEWEGIPGHSSPVPSRPFYSTWTDVTTDTESGESRVHTSHNVKAAEAFRLQLRRLVPRQHDVVDMAVILEHGIVEPFHAGRLA